MIITAYVVLFILIVIAITYPKEFPALMRHPKMLIDIIAFESRRRWMILKHGTPLWVSKQRMAYSLWKMRGIIAKEQAKQQTNKQTTKLNDRQVLREDLH